MNKASQKLQLFSKITHDAVTRAKHPPSQRLPASPPALRGRAREGRVSSLWDQRWFSVVRPLPPRRLFEMWESLGSSEGKATGQSKPEIKPAIRAAPKYI